MRIIEWFVVVIIISILSVIAVSVFLEANRPASKTVVLPRQPINNPEYFRQMDQIMAKLPNAEARLRFLAQQGCAADIGLIGVYGSYKGMPLGDRLNKLNDMYNALRPKATDHSLPDSMNEAEHAICPGQAPIG